MLFWLLMAVIGTMAFFPDTAIAKWLQHNLVERPAAWLSSLSPTRILMGIVIAPVFVMLVLAAPELLPLIATMGDAAMMAEVFLLIWVASVSNSFKGLWKRVCVLCMVALRLLRRTRSLFQRSSRSRKRRKRPGAGRPPSGGRSEDEPGHVWALA